MVGLNKMKNAPEEIAQEVIARFLEFLFCTILFLDVKDYYSKPLLCDTVRQP